MKRLFFVLPALVMLQSALGHAKLPIIRATSKTVDIRDGDWYLKGQWTITPFSNPDVYTTSARGKRVVSYTDKDSIAVYITPKTRFQFIILLCKRDNCSLNCKGLATVLNECYLSLGIPSRIVTYMPKDSVFDDSHVINAVYANELNKWLWIDPTNDAYVMNENGTFLSIEEVRERLVHDKPLILNPEANRNHRVSVTKEEYLYRYMAKNLYRIE